MFSLLGFFAVLLIIVKELQSDWFIVDNRLGEMLVHDLLVSVLEC
jgi:hypothetical protein